jgi:hypothetical protein
VKQSDRKTAKPEERAISPIDPDTMPRAEDDEKTFASSPEFHDRPDPLLPPGKKKQPRTP